MAQTTKTTVTIEGMASTLAALKRQPELARSLMATVVQQTAFSAAQRVRAGAPQATGTLRGAIGYSARGLNGRVTVGPQGYYWRFVEYGTRHMAARPFVRAAAEQEAPDYARRAAAIGAKLERDFASGRTI